jgi:hypothetical protein
MLVRAGFVVVLVLVNVYGFRPILARGWHGRTSSLSGLLRDSAQVHQARLQCLPCGPGVTVMTLADLLIGHAAGTLMALDVASAI